MIYNPPCFYRLLGLLGLLFCLTEALGQPTPVEKSPPTASAIIDQWVNEIIERKSRDVEKRSDSLLATFVQREDSFNLYYKIGRGYFMGDDHLQSRRFLKNAISLAENGNMETQKAFFFLGTCEDVIQDYEKAILYFDACFQQYEVMKEPSSLAKWLGAFALNYSGTGHARLGDFNSAYIKQTKGLAMGREGEFDDVQKKCLIDLGTTYENLGQINEAVSSYQEAFSIAERNQMFDEDYAIAKLDISSIWIKQRKWDDAEDDLKTAIQVFTWLEEDAIGPLQSEYQSRLAQAYDALGLLFIEKGQKQKALQTIETAISFGEKAYSQGRDRDLGRVYVHQAEVLRELGKPEEALHACQYALHCILPDKPVSTAPSLPDAGSFYPEFVLLEALTTQAKCLMEKYESSQALSDLNMVLDCHELANTAAELLRTGVGHDDDKLLLTQETHQRTEQALAAAYARYKLEPSEKFWRLAFEFAERSKANLLLEAFQDQEARIQIGLPDSIVDREMGLQRTLIEAEQALKDLKLSESSEKETVTKAEDALFYAREQMDAFKRELEAAYPNYFNLKYTTELPSLAELRSQLLGNGDAMIEFFMGEEYVYLFMLTEKEQHFFRKKNSESLTKLIKQTLRSLTSLKDKERALYAGNAYQLYQELLGSLPIDAGQRLLIIPDRELALLPFEALLISEIKEPMPFSSYPFLIKEHICSYAYSAHLLYQTQTRRKASQKHKTTFLGMAPGNFPQSNLAELPHTLEEVSSLKKRLGGKAFIAEQAQKDNLLNQSADAQILHLSTHAVASDEAGNSTWIALREGSDKTIKIRLAEVAALNLKADMTVLSACETGAGEIKRGEGVMSLARAFTYAGSQATIQSLWPVRPAAAAPLMEAFYAGLLAGKDKAIALHEAKLSLLHGDDPALHAPLMWAAFAAIGDMRAIEISSTWGWQMWGLLGLGVVLVGFLGMAWRKRSN